MRKIAVLLAAFASIPLHARAQTQHPAYEPEELAISAYMAESGVSPKEARRRLIAEDEANTALEPILQRLDDRIAGAYWSTEPDQDFTIRVKGKLPDGLPPFIPTSAGAVPIVYEEDAPYSRSELFAIIQENNELLFSAIPGLQGIWLDERTGEIVLDVHASASDMEAYAGEGDAIRMALQIPVRFNRLSAKMKTGSMSLESAGD